MRLEPSLSDLQGKQSNTQSSYGRTKLYRPLETKVHLHACEAKTARMHLLTIGRQPLLITSEVDC